MRALWLRKAMGRRRILFASTASSIIVKHFPWNRPCKPKTLVLAPTLRPWTWEIMWCSHNDRVGVISCDDFDNCWFVLANRGRGSEYGITMNYSILWSEWGGRSVSSNIFLYLWLSRSAYVALHGWGLGWSYAFKPDSGENVHWKELSWHIWDVYNCITVYLHCFLNSQLGDPVAHMEAPVWHLLQEQGLLTDDLIQDSLSKRPQANSAKLWRERISSPRHVVGLEILASPLHLLGTTLAEQVFWAFECQLCQARSMISSWSLKRLRKEPLKRPGSLEECSFPLTQKWESSRW